MTVNFAQVTADACFRAFAEPVTFAGTEVQGITENQLVNLPGYEDLVEPRSTLTVRKADVPTIQKGQTVIIRGQSYQVDQKITKASPTASAQSDFDVLVTVLLR